MNDELKLAYEQIMQAVRSEDIFGVPENNIDTLEAVKKAYRRLSKAVHPDRHNNDPDAKEIAEEAFKRLNEFLERAEKRIAKGAYGTNAKEEETNRGSSGFTIKTPKREYRITSTIAQGDIAVVYGGDCLGGDDFSGKIAVKLVEDPKDNDLFQNEVRVLRLFQTEPSKQNKHLPFLLDQFKTSDNRLGTILRYIDAYDFYSIREKYPHGVPAEHAVWILARLLSALGYSHSKGVIHGNIEPAHLMASPKDHNLFVIDWCYATINSLQTGDGFKAWNENYSPPEAKERQMPTPAADLYSVGKCIIYLLGGDIKNNSMPYLVDQRFQRFIQFFVRESSLQRAQDAWEMYDKLMELRTEIWGEPKFIELPI
jgi:serine/threonine protein kinase